MPLKWTFDPPGDWEAGSAIKDDDGDALDWRIQVVEDGTFNVSESDRELIPYPVRCFPMLAKAQEWCELVEAALVAGRPRPPEPNDGRRDFILADALTRISERAAKVKLGGDVWAAITAIQAICLEAADKLAKIG